MRAFTDEKKERAVRIRRRIALIMALIAAAVAVAPVFPALCHLPAGQGGLYLFLPPGGDLLPDGGGGEGDHASGRQDRAAAHPRAGRGGGGAAAVQKAGGLGDPLYAGGAGAHRRLIALNAATSHFVDIGVSRVEVAYHTALALALLSSLLAAVCAMWTRGGEKLAEAVFLVFACMSVGSVILITVYMLTSGAPAIAEVGLFQFLFGTEWNPNKDIYGIGYMLLASVAGMAGAILIGVPIGLLTAIFLAELAPRRLAGVVRPAVELLAGIPSVIYGFFGMIVLVPFTAGCSPPPSGTACWR